MTLFAHLWLLKSSHCKKRSLGTFLRTQMRLSLQLSCLGMLRQEQNLPPANPSSSYNTSLPISAQNPTNQTQTKVAALLCPHSLYHHDQPSLPHQPKRIPKRLLDILYQDMTSMLMACTLCLYIRMENGKRTNEIGQRQLQSFCFRNMKYSFGKMTEKM